MPLLSTILYTFSLLVALLAGALVVHGLVRYALASSKTTIACTQWQFLGRRDFVFFAQCVGYSCTRQLACFVSVPHNLPTQFRPTVPTCPLCIVGLLGVMQGFI